MLAGPRKSYWKEPEYYLKAEEMPDSHGGFQDFAVLLKAQMFKPVPYGLDDHG